MLNVTHTQPAIEARAQKPHPQIGLVTIVPSNPFFAEQSASRQFSSEARIATGAMETVNLIAATLALANGSQPLSDYASQDVAAEGLVRRIEYGHQYDSAAALAAAFTAVQEILNSPENQGFSVTRNDNRLTIFTPTTYHHGG